MSQNNKKKKKDTKKKKEIINQEIKRPPRDVSIVNTYSCMSYSYTHYPKST